MIDLTQEIQGMKASGTDTIVRGKEYLRGNLNIFCSLQGLMAEASPSLPQKSLEETWFYLLGVWDYHFSTAWEGITEMQKKGRAVIWRAYTDGQPQQAVQRKLQSLTLPKKGKRLAARRDQWYLEGYLEAFKAGRVRFLYHYKNGYYCTGLASKQFQHWDVLPQEAWKALGRCGGMYWVYDDGRAPAVFLEET